MGAGGFAVRLGTQGNCIFLRLGRRVPRVPRATRAFRAAITGMRPGGPGGTGPGRGGRYAVRSVLQRRAVLLCESGVSNPVQDVAPAVHEDEARPESEEERTDRSPLIEPSAAPRGPVGSWGFSVELPRVAEFSRSSIDRDAVKAMIGKSLKA